MSRAETLVRLRVRPKTQALVIGGGINGISVFRELALQGLDVVLAEKADFCSGASAALSRMVHGGLRYLENGEFRLVRESLLERDRLLQNAPHMVGPLPTTVPIFETFSGIGNGAVRFLGLSRRPGRRGALVIKAGLTLYDMFTGGRRAMPAHEFRSRRSTLAKWPAINPAIRNSATYYDACVTRPERLGIEMLKDVLAQNAKASALNYAEVSRSGDGLVVRDLLGSDEFQLQPEIVVNATGGWIDLTNAAIGSSNARLMGGTKGSHLIVANAALYAALDGHMIYYENEDGRICILFPYLGNVLVGSTDIRVENPDEVRCEPEERAYILQSLAFVFPDIAIADADIIYQFSGVRPLPASEDKVTGRIPRDHFCTIIEGSPPTLCMIGGKWTTFRSFGALAADGVFGRLGLKRISGTEDLAIGGGRDFPADPQAWCQALAERLGLERERVASLLERYGAEAAGVAAFVAEGPDSDLPGTFYSQREVLYLIRNEFVESLADIFLRRTTLAITGAMSLASIDVVLDLLADERAWPDPRKNLERAQFLATLIHFHGLDEASLLRRDTNRIAAWPTKKSA